MVEEMVASRWRLRRAWAIETRLLDNEADAQTAADPVDRIAAAFEELAAKPALALMHRGQTRPPLMYPRTCHSLLLLRAATVSNEPSLTSGHPSTTALLACPHHAPAIPEPSEVAVAQ